MDYDTQLSSLITEVLKVYCSQDLKICHFSSSLCPRTAVVTPFSEVQHFPLLSHFPKSQTYPTFSTSSNQHQVKAINSFQRAVAAQTHMAASHVTL